MTAENQQLDVPQLVRDAVERTGCWWHAEVQRATQGVVAVVCGRNIDLEVFKKIISQVT